MKACEKEENPCVSDDMLNKARDGRLRSLIPCFSSVITPRHTRTHASLSFRFANHLSSAKTTSSIDFTSTWAPDS